jgi:hypothetical protein
MELHHTNQGGFHSLDDKFLKFSILALTFYLPLTAKMTFISNKKCPMILDALDSLLLLR